MEKSDPSWLTNICSRSFSRWISPSFMRATAPGSDWMFTTALFWMFRARSANLSVEMDSSADISDGETVTMNVVEQLPPRLSWRMCVSLESR